MDLGNYLLIFGDMKKAEIPLTLWYLAGVGNVVPGNQFDGARR